MLVELVRESQVEILRALATSKENTDIRIRTIEANVTLVDSGLSQRLSNVEKRLWEIIFRRPAA